MMVVSCSLNISRQLWRIVGMALQALWAYKLRSLFVIAGVALGIASLTVIVAAVDGAERKANEIVRWFGHDAVLVFGGNIENRAVGQRSLTLTYADADALRRSLPAVYLVVPMRGKSNQSLRFENRVVQVPLVIGTSEGYAEAWDWPLVEGRDLSAEDLARGAKVGLIGDNTARELFGDRSPVGHTVLVNKVPVQIIGRLSYRGVVSGSGSIDDRIIIPITTLTQRFNLNRKYFRALRVKFHAPELMTEHIANLRSLLRHLHHLQPEELDDFTILSAEEILKFLSMFKSGLLLFLGITALVAMTVGGFVLANLFYLSINERRMEIGLKKALGARNWAILCQVLIEAVCLTLIGALLGMGLGMALGQLLARLGLLQILFSWKVFGMAVTAALAIGILFGLKPARQAAALNPIEVLKSAG